MDGKLKYMLLKTVQEDNILPVTSICDVACRFCSHLNNPKELEVYRFGHLDLEVIKELIDYLPANGPVIIGESATKIIEGEPFTHPHIREIITLLRRKYSLKPIHLTTNGSLLTRDLISFLESMAPVKLNISVNCGSPAERVFLMRDKRGEQVFKALNILREKDIPFQTSLVAMPHLMGWDYLYNTIGVIKENGPELIKVYLPGYTEYAEKELHFETDELYKKMKQFVEGIAVKINIPVILEPPMLEDFTCRIKGIIQGSPAARTELKYGDIIKKVDGKKVITRVDAFQKIKEQANPRLDIVSGDNVPNSIVLKKKAGERPGIVMNYDLDPRVIDKLRQVVWAAREEKVGIVTSHLARSLIKLIVKDIEGDFPAKEIKVIPVANNYFGGSIMSAGLLVNQDVVKAFRKEKIDCDLLLIPGIIYDNFGNDLTGANYKELLNKINTRIEIID